MLNTIRCEFTKVHEFVIWQLFLYNRDDNIISFFTTAISQELTWANAEDNPHFTVFFGKLAELQFMHSEAEKQMAEKVSTQIYLKII